MSKIVILLLFFVNTAIATELKTITPQEFLASNPSPERQALTDFFVHQIDRYRTNGITQAQLDQAWNDLELRNKSAMMRFQIIDQKLYADAYDIVDSSFATYTKFLKNILSHYKIENLDFIVHSLECELRAESILQ